MVDLLLSGGWPVFYLSEGAGPSLIRLVRAIFLWLSGHVSPSRLSIQLLVFIMLYLRLGVGACTLKYVCVRAYACVCTILIRVKSTLRIPLARVYVLLYTCLCIYAIIYMMLYICYCISGGVHMPIYTCRCIYVKSIHVSVHMLLYTCWCTYANVHIASSINEGLCSYLYSTLTLPVIKMPNLGTSLCTTPHLTYTVDEAMKIWFDGGEGYVFASVSEWLQSTNGQLLQSAAFAIGNFARGESNGDIIIQRGISLELYKSLDQLQGVADDARTAPTIHAILSALRNMAIAREFRSLDNLERRL